MNPALQLHVLPGARQPIYRQIAPQAGDAIGELRLAREVQRRLLPPPQVEGDGFRVAARSRPARFVAGDFYDVLRGADPGVGTVVADVAGKGIGPSLIMATVKAVLPFLAAERGVAETLAALNERLVRELGRREFVALAYARFDPRRRRLCLANAGLPDPWLLRPGEPPEELKVGGPRLPLGKIAGLAYETLEVPLLPGERFLLLTDGLPEALTLSGEPLGYDALARHLAASHAEDGGEPADVWLERFLERLRRATGRRADDDTTALVLESPKP